MIRLVFITIAFIVKASTCFSQNTYWQQEIAYRMDVDMDVKSHRYTGTSEITYYNNSPDTLYKVYFHLFNNAFQPGSSMDLLSQSIEDPDPRIGSRIAAYGPEEIGYLHVKSLNCDGQNLDFKEEETILEVTLAKPLRPGKKIKFTLQFEGQSPIQTRRSGRDNKEDVAYSMSQWYPKMCEFDASGWHADPYIGREFYGVWGSFDVRIRIDSAFTIGGTGVLQNPKEIGHGYADSGTKLTRPQGNKLTWHFKADKVHDFMWAADPEFIHTRRKMENGPELHFIRKNTPDIAENWTKLEEYTERAMKFASANFGEYPWPQFSVIQGGDYGMEYPMATLITGKRKLGSVVGTTVHELMHCWYYGVLASNEGQYAWMDEGFTTYSANLVMNHLFPESAKDIPNYYQGYINLALSGEEEPMSTSADHFIRNSAYSATTYSKGGTFVNQLNYILGSNTLSEVLKRYFMTWKFKHPDPNDFIRVAEKVSGTHLKWYLNFMMNTTSQIDYGFGEIKGDESGVQIGLVRNGQMPMPIDLAITLMNGEIQYYTIPLDVMRNAKTSDGNISYTVLPDWKWAVDSYPVKLPISIESIAEIAIDPKGGMADIDRENNRIYLNGTEKTSIIN